MGLGLNLTPREIAKGVLCTPECISKLRHNNREYKQYLATHLAYNTLKEFREELEAYKYPTLTYKLAEGVTINISNGANTMIRSIKIGANEYIYKNIAYDIEEKIICIITPARNKIHSYAREDNELIIFRDGVEISAVSATNVSDELYLSREAGKIYYVAEGPGAGYHRYNTLYSINYKADSPGKPVKLYKKTAEDTIYLSDNYMILWNYSGEPRIYSLDNIGSQVRNKYYRNGCILEKPPADSLFMCSGVYEVHIRHGRVSIKIKGKTLFEMLGGKIETIKGGVFLIQPIDGFAYIYDAEHGIPLTPYKPDKSLNVHADKNTICVHNKKFSDPRKALFVFYGAYGIQTSMIYPYHNWAPLVSRGWRIIYIMARGGGDNGYAWEKAGRNSYHANTIKDVVESIKYMRKKHNLAWDKTAIYSRSAGGIPAGIVTLMRLTGISFMEHPFVDIVETMGNPAFPLTETEVGEFGDSRVVDLHEVSPMNSDIGLTALDYPAPNVLVRTGSEDVQVYSYEPLKFVERLRELGYSKEKEVLLACEEGEGHFYRPEKWLESRAADCAILDLWASGEKISGKGIKMANKNKTRANRNKNKMNKNKNRTQRNKNLEGGKRKKSRKATRRTRRRVGRKH